MRTLHLLWRWDDEARAGEFFGVNPAEMQPTHVPFSPVNIRDPDPVAHPGFAHAHRLVCDVAAGETLYLPSYWWHEVTSLPTSHRAAPHGADFEFDGAADGGGTDACGATVSVNYFYSPRYHKGSDFEHYANEPFYAAFLGGRGGASRAGASSTSGAARAASAAGARDDEHVNEPHVHHESSQLSHVAHPRRWQRLRERV